MEEGLLKVLLELGLHEKAATVYLALLGKSRLSIADLARDSGIKRATCYEQLDVLLQRGFVMRVPVGKRTYYAAESPKNILTEFKKKTAAFEQKVGELEHLHEAATNKPRVQFYEGKRELGHIYDNMFKTVGDICSIFPAEEFFKSFTEQDYDEFDKTVSAHAFKSRDLFVASKHYKKLKEIRAKNGGADKLDKKLPLDFKSNVDVLIYSDKVALISLCDLSGIVIENKDIAELFKNIHSFIWKTL